MDGTQAFGHPVERLARALRVPAFAGCTVLLAVLAHVLAGGATPRCGLVLLLTAVVALLWRAASGAEHSLPRLLLGVIGAQLGLHVAMLEHAGHRPDPAAALAHLAAAVLLALVLRRHELACRPRRLAALLALAGGAPCLRIAPNGSHAPTRRTTRPHPAPAIRIPHRRGPPLPERLAA